MKREGKTNLSIVNSRRECKSPATLTGLVLPRWKTPIDELVPVYSRQRSMNIDEEDLDVRR